MFFGTWNLTPKICGRVELELLEGRKCVEIKVVSRKGWRMERGRRYIVLRERETLAKLVVKYIESVKKGRSHRAGGEWYW